MSRTRTVDTLVRSRSNIEQEIGQLIVSNRDSLQLDALGYADRMHLEALLHEHSMSESMTSLHITEIATDDYRKRVARHAEPEEILV